MGLFNFLKKKEVKQSITAQSLNNQMDMAVAMFQSTINALTSVSQSANETIAAHTAQIEALQEENRKLMSAADKAETIKDRLSKILD